MLTFMTLAGGAAAVSMAGFYSKEQAHRSRMAGLDINVHINGIRGKSTITRMVGGVLREANYNTISKTTGTYACVIDTDASEHPIKRTGPANINEQYRFLKEWIQPQTEALVVECMAVKPKYQVLCQDVILRSPLSVITNVRLDHQEDMGDTREEIAASLCSTVPMGGTLVTGERDEHIVKIIREHCEARNTKLVVAPHTELSESLVDKFSYHQFEENVAVALSVAEELGIDAETAARGMLRAEPDPGTTKITPVQVSEGDMFYWVPMFAINDWESTTKVYRSVSEQALPEGCKRVIALNNRSDRTDRAQMFIDLVTEDLMNEFDRVILYGDIQEAVRQKLINKGVPEDAVVSTLDMDEDASGHDLIARARDGFGTDPVAIFGMVNIHTEHVISMNRFVDAVVEGNLARTTAAATNSTTTNSTNHTAPMPVVEPAYQGGN